MRAAVGMLQRQGWLVRRQSLGTFVADPVGDGLSCGVRTIAEGVVELWCYPAGRRAVTPDRTGAATSFRDARLVEVLCIRQRIRTGDQPWPWSRPIFRPAWAQPSSRCYRAARTRDHMRCGSGDWCTHCTSYPRIRPPNLPRQQRYDGGFAVWSSTTASPMTALEVVVFHRPSGTSSPSRYPDVADQVPGIEKRDFA